jgi:Zn-dependent membrane protease YugP
MGLIVIFIVFGILSFAINARLKSKFKKYSQIQLRSNMSGKEVAERMLHDNGIHDVKVVSVQGQLTDHYNPLNKTVNLSEAVYNGRTAASAAISAHECGHAVQHATAYSMLQLRSSLVPIQNASGKILNFIMMISIFGGFFVLGTSWQLLLVVVIGCYFVLTMFSFITLPVEFDASKRALAWIDEQGIVSSQEHEMAKDALKWAAMTYVVAALGSLVALLYFLSIFLGGRD